jgi:hypothetical protein
MNYNRLKKTFTLSNGRIVTEQNAALYRAGFFTTAKRAARAMDAEALGWTNVTCDASGKIIGLPPNPDSPMAFEEVP